MLAFDWLLKEQKGSARAYDLERRQDGSCMTDLRRSEVTHAWVLQQVQSRAFEEGVVHMRIEVVGRNVEITPAIREYAESKAQKLPRYFDRVMYITITLTKEDSQRHGDFGVDFVINVERHPPFIAKSSDSDLYAAVDQAMAKSQRQLHDFKEKLTQGNR